MLAQQHKLDSNHSVGSGKLHVLWMPVRLLSVSCGASACYEVCWTLCFTAPMLWCNPCMLWSLLDPLLHCADAVVQSLHAMKSVGPSASLRRCCGAIPSCYEVFWTLCFTVPMLWCNPCMLWSLLDPLLHCANAVVQSLHAMKSVGPSASLHQCCGAIPACYEVCWTLCFTVRMLWCNPCMLWSLLDPLLHCANAVVQSCVAVLRACTDGAANILHDCIDLNHSAYLPNFISGDFDSVRPDILD